MIEGAVPLARATDRARYGGKAAALAGALAHDLPVPGGVALDVALVARAARGEGAAREACASVLETMKTSVAVRSSAIDEDGNRASFAGQHVTRLGVATPARLIEAIEEVWASAQSAGALAYRRKLGLEEPPTIAVVVQKMIDADRAGVLFTKNPVTGADERVIEASWGLGEAVVGGLVVPDRYRVARGGTIVERSSGDKDIAIRLTANETTTCAVADELRTAHCLDDTCLARLDALATACERIDPEPQDIEWAFADGELFLLQRRPVTR